MMAKLNPYLLDALHLWGAYRRDDDIQGMGYATTTIESKMIDGTAWSRGGVSPEPEYTTDQTVQAVKLIVRGMPHDAQICLWTAYVGHDGPMSLEDARRACGKSAGDYQALLDHAHRIVAEGLNMALYIR